MQTNTIGGRRLVKPWDLCTSLVLCSTFFDSPADWHAVSACYQGNACQVSLLHVMQPHCMQGSCQALSATTRDVCQGKDILPAQHMLQQSVDQLQRKDTCNLCICPAFLQKLQSCQECRRYHFLLLQAVKGLCPVGAWCAEKSA